jgi:hypothetical protein
MAETGATAVAGNQTPCPDTALGEEEFAAAWASGAALAPEQAVAEALAGVPRP